MPEKFIRWQMKPESCNVDVIEAQRRGITVLGVKDSVAPVIEYVTQDIMHLIETVQPQK